MDHTAKKMRGALLLFGAAFAFGDVTVLSEVEAAVQMGEFDVIVDVRSEASYAASHIAGAVLQSHTNLQGCEGKKVAFYCASGSASSSAAHDYASSSNSESAYAIGTLDGLSNQGVATESGMPESHDPGCVEGGMPPTNKERPPYATICIGALVGLLLVMAVATVLYKACCTTKRPATASSTEETSTEKKLPAA